LTSTISNPADLAAETSIAQLKKHCRGHLTPFKIPEKMQFVDALERTAIGKLIRRILK
jgi:long-chain acyl-CoA synthetase